MQISFYINGNFSYRREMEARKFTMDYGDVLIEEARKRKEEDAVTKKETKSLKIEYIIDQLVNHEEKFTNQEIREHLMVLMITVSN